MRTVLMMACGDAFVRMIGCSIRDLRQLEWLVNENGSSMRARSKSLEALRVRTSSVSLLCLTHQRRLWYVGLLGGFGASGRGPLLVMVP